MKCEKCDAEFSLRALARAKGKCPCCGEMLPVSRYCTFIPDRRWFRMYSAAPLSIKLAVLVLSLIGSGVIGVLGLFWGGNIYLGDGKDVGWLAVAIAATAFVVFGPMMRAAVRGRLPYVFMTAIITLGLWSSRSIEDCLIIFLPWLIFMIPFFVPASRRWRERCREEDVAYWTARKSGEDLSVLQLSEHRIKLSAVSIFLVVTVGLILWATLSTYEFTGELFDKSQVGR